MSATADNLTQILLKGMKQPEGKEPEARNLEGQRPVSGDELLKALNPNHKPEVAIVGEGKEQAPESAQDENEQPEVAADDTNQPEVADTPEEQDGDSIGSLTRLAEELGVEPEALYKLEIPLKNSDRSLTIGELKDMYSDGLSKSEQLKEKEQELDSKRTVYEQQLAQLANAQALPAELIQAQAELLKAQTDYQNTDWVTLESQNPGQAALTRQKLTEAVQLADYRRSQIEQALRESQQAIEQQRKNEWDKQLDLRRRMLENLIPEWSDSTKAKAERVELVSYATKNDIPEDVISFIMDYGHPALVKAFRRLYEHDKAVVKLKEPKQPIAKTLSVKTVHQTNRGQQAVLEKLVKQAKGTKDLRVKQEAIRRLLTG